MANTKITSNVISDDINLGGNPTTTTQSAGNNTTRIATTAFVKAAIDATIDSAPGALDTLNELAAAIGDDANFSTTITNSIATKLPLAGGTLTGDLNINANLHAGDGTNISMDSSANGQLEVDGNGYQGAIALDGTGMHIYHNSASRSLILGTNETARLTIDGTGNVGIGQAPNMKLNILHADQDGLRFNTANDAETFIDFGDTDDNDIGRISYDHADNSMSFRTSNEEKLIITNTGKIGVGNLSPTAKLDLGTNGVTRNSTYDVSATAYISTSGGAATNTAASIPLTLGRDDGASTGDEIGLTYNFDDGNWSSTAGVFARVESATTAYTALDLRTWGGGWNTGLTINSSGNVGIGETNILGKLHVEDTSWSSGSPYGTVVYIEGGNVNDLNWGHLVVSQSGTTTDTGGRISLGANGQNPIAGLRAKYKGATYGDLALLTRPSGGTNKERMLLKSNGGIQQQSHVSTSNRKEEVFHTKTVGTSYVDFFSVDVLSTHRAVFYEIITFGSDWSGHSAARSYYKGFVSGTTSYSGDGEIENSGTYGSGSHIDWNYTRSGSTVTFQAKLYSGTVSLEAYIRVIGTFGDITLL